MPRLLVLFLALLLPLLPNAAVAQAPAMRPGCATDTAIAACVTSASIVFDSRYDVGDNPIAVRVSATLRILNSTEYPIRLAVLSDSWAFTPQNGATLSGYAEVSGLAECNRPTDCAFTTVAPGRTALVQVTFGSGFGASGLPLMQIARTASLSASLYVDERGETRIVSVPLEGFGFGNGLTRGS